MASERPISSVVPCIGRRPDQIFDGLGRAVLNLATKTNEAPAPISPEA
jgi:hypothetical protein